MGGRNGFLSIAIVALAMLLCAGNAHATWQPGTVVSGPTSSPFDDLAVGTNVRGDAMVVWRNWRDSYNSTLEAARRPAGGRWASPVEVSDPASSYPDPRPNATTAHPDDPAVAVAPDGEAIIAWARAANSMSDYNGADFVRVMVVPPGQSRGSPVTLARGSSTRVKTAVGYDDRGNATLFYWDMYGLYVTTRPAGGTFAAPTRLSADGETVSDPQFAFAANGAVAGIYSGGSGTEYIVRDAGRTLVRGRLAAPAGPVQGLSVAMNDSGAAVFGWSECADPDVCDSGVFKAAYRPTGGPVSPTEVVQSSWASPALGVSPAGEATAVFDGVSAEAPLLAATRPPGGHFGVPERVTTVSPGGALSAAYDRRGNLHVGWNTYYGGDPSTARPYVTMRPAGGEWQPAYTPPGIPNLAAPALAPGPDGWMLAAWWTSVDVRMADFAPGDPPPARPEPSSPQPGDPPSGDLPAGAQPAPAPSSGAPAPSSGAPAPSSGAPAPQAALSSPHDPSAAGPRRASARTATSSFASRLSSLIAGGGSARIARGQMPRAMFTPPGAGTLTVTLALGRSVIATTTRAISSPALVSMRPRRSGLQRLARARARSDRQSLRLRVTFRSETGDVARVSRSLRLSR